MRSLHASVALPGVGKWSSMRQKACEVQLAPFHDSSSPQQTARHVPNFVGSRPCHAASPGVMSTAAWRSACNAHSTPGLSLLACQTMPNGPGSEVKPSGSRATSPRAASLRARPRETTDNVLEPASRLRLVAIAELSIHAGGGTRPAAMKVSSMQRRNAVPAGGISQGWAEASRQLGAISWAKGWSGAQMTGPSASSPRS